MTILTAICCCTLLGLLSCSSPSDVEANRRTTVTNPPFDASLFLEVNRDHSDFGAVHRNSHRTLRLELSNNSTEESITIDRLEFSSNKFSLKLADNRSLPVSLTPKGSPGSVLLVDITFRPGGLFGDFVDALKVNGFSRAIASVHGLSPMILIEDIDFGEVPLRNKDWSFARIENLTTKSATVHEWRLTNPNGVLIAEIPDTVFTVDAGSSFTFIMRYEPRSLKKLEAQVEFSISGVEFVDSLCLMKGEGI